MLITFNIVLQVPKNMIEFFKINDTILFLLSMLIASPFFVPCGFFKKAIIQ